MTSEIGEYRSTVGTRTGFLAIVGKGLRESKDDRLKRYGQEMGKELEILKTFPDDTPFDESIRARLKRM